MTPGRPVSVAHRIIGVAWAAWTGFLVASAIQVDHLYWEAAVPSALLAYLFLAGSVR